MHTIELLMSFVYKESEKKKRKTPKTKYEQPVEQKYAPKKETLIK